jgi:3-oxoacyl-[acyl-carrier-protein] synthase III
VHNLYRGRSVRYEYNVPYIIQNDLGLENAEVFSVEQECAATLLAVNLGRLLLNASQKGRVVILTSNFADTLEERLMGLFTISDAVGLIEVSNGTQGLCFMDFLSSSDGSIVGVNDILVNMEQIASRGTALLQKVLQQNFL